MGSSPEWSAGAVPLSPEFASLQFLEILRTNFLGAPGGCNLHISSHMQNEIQKWWYRVCREVEVVRRRPPLRLLGESAEADSACLGN